MNTVWEGMQKPKPSQQSVRDATVMLLHEESALWKCPNPLKPVPSKHFKAATLARAAVLTAEETLRHQLTGHGEVGNENFYTLVQ